MNRYRQSGPRTAALALAASAVLVTAACGGGDDSSDDGAGGPSDRGAPTDTAPDEDTVEPDPDDDGDSDDGSWNGGDEGDSAETPAEVRPETRLPDDVELTLDWETPDNAYREQAIEDTAAFLEALHEAIAAQDPDHPTYQVYSEGEARDDAEEWITTWVDAGVVPQGTDRYYKATLTGHESGEIITTVEFCRDTNWLAAVDAETGEPAPLPIDAHQTEYTFFVNNPVGDEDDTYRPRHIMTMEESSTCEE